MATTLNPGFVQPTSQQNPDCELKPYPFPPGMAIPRLMPYQQYPWNNDHHLAAEVLRLKEAHGLRYAVETGTCLGSTAIWLSENFEHVVTFEVHEPYYAIAKERATKASVQLGSSVKDDNLESVFDYPTKGHRHFVFLDAHWGPNCPLELELMHIHRGTINYAHEDKPCILIHDFQVPGTDFGFDSMPDGRPFNLELIADHLNRIYGIGGWKHNYPTEVAGAMRGWVSIEPCL